jgi:formamidopyrimidine-DNA glycosylase
VPELPEVETTCRGIQPAIKGRYIDQVIVRQKQLRWPVSSNISKLRKLKIIGVSRRAKYILLQTAVGSFIIHLGMSGRLGVINSDNPVQKHDHVDFKLDNETSLRYTDPRRFGFVLWTKNDPLDYSLLANLGPEPFSKTFSARYLFQCAQRKKISVKQLIMDQTIVVGVGNIYANEALFAAKLLPTRLAFTLSLSDCQRLVSCIQKILKQAIKQGGTTLRDFLSADGKPGYFVQKLLVYGREGEDCFSCNASLNEIRINQRTTVFCSVCQK